MQSVISQLHLALFKKIWWHNSCLSVKHHRYYHQIRATSWSSPNLVEITTTLYHIARVMSPNFLKKCQMQPISQDQWQIAKFILEFKSTHPKCVNFKRVRAGSIFFAIRLIVQCGLYITLTCTEIWQKSARIIFDLQVILERGVKSQMSW